MRIFPADFLFPMYPWKRSGAGGHTVGTLFSHLVVASNGRSSDFTRGTWILNWELINVFFIIIKKTSRIDLCI